MIEKETAIFILSLSKEAKTIKILNVTMKKAFKTLYATPKYG